MTSGTRTLDPILLLILLALLLQPFVYVWLAPGPGKATTMPAPDPRLASAMEDLARALRARPASSPGVAESARTGESPQSTPDAPPAPAPEPSTLEPIATPEDGTPFVPASVQVYPRQTERIEAWVRAQRETKARTGQPDYRLFFHRTSDELLRSLGVPDDVSTGSGAVRWTYKSKESRGRLDLWILDGRVYKCYFNG
jgi:hypothetical protein